MKLKRARRGGVAVRGGSQRVPEAIRLDPKTRQQNSETQGDAAVETRRSETRRTAMF